MKKKIRNFTKKAENHLRMVWALLNEIRMRAEKAYWSRGDFPREGI